MAGWERRSTAELRPGGTKADRSRLTKAERIRRAEAMGGQTTIVPKMKRVVAKQLVAGEDRSFEAAVARANRAAATGEYHRLVAQADAALARRRAR